MSKVSTVDHQTQTEHRLDDETEALQVAAAISSTGDRSIHISNLNDNITERDLRKYFGSFGPITAVNMKCNANFIYARGFAFVIFETRTALERALAHSDYVVQGQQLKVDRAKPRNNRIFVGGLPAGTTKAQVLHYFQCFGPVLSVEAPKNRCGHILKGDCFVTLYSERLTFDVLMVKKHIFEGKKIDVRRAVPRSMAKKFKDTAQAQLLQYEQEFYESSLSSRDSNSSVDSSASLPLCQMN